MNPSVDQRASYTVFFHIRSVETFVDEGVDD